MQQSSFIKKHKNEILIAVGIICAVFLLLVSGCEGETDEEDYQISEEVYEKNVEKRLSELISQIKGVGSVNVMVSVDCGAEYVYAANSEQSENSEKKSYFTNGDKEPLLIKEVRPRIRGVAVVCEGGGNVGVQSKIISLVSSVLDVSSSRIFVGS